MTVNPVVRRSLVLLVVAAVIVAVAALIDLPGRGGGSPPTVVPDGHASEATRSEEIERMQAYIDAWSVPNQGGH